MKLSDVKGNIDNYFNSTDAKEVIRQFEEMGYKFDITKTNNMKTLDEFKIQVAKENGMNKLVTGHAASYFDEASERYANYKAEMSHDNACDSQLQLISDTFRENAHKGDKQSDIDVFEAIADTIKSHPQPENPYSKK